MDVKVLKRRAEMLDMVCKGFHPVVVISQLSEKYSVSKELLVERLGKKGAKNGFL